MAILGDGVSGRAQKITPCKSRVADLFDEKNRIFTESHAQHYSFIVQSPGFRPDHAWLKLAVDQNIPVFSEVDLGLSYSDHLKVVAITGTNGKTSLADYFGPYYEAIEYGLDCARKYWSSHIGWGCRRFSEEKNYIS